MRTLLRGLALVVPLLVAACATTPPPPAEAPRPRPAPATPQEPAPPAVEPVLPPPPINAAAAGVTVVSPSLLTDANAVRTLTAFRRSCPALIKRTDKSGLTAGSDWVGVCATAASLPDAGAAAFFRDQFDWVRVGDGAAFATGYYEPEIAGSRVRQPGFEIPVHAKPNDLVRCTRPDGTSGRGRIDETGTCTAYFTRAEIEDGAIDGKGLELAYAADPVELFFLEIQGSGRLRLPDGSVMRIGYADQNGREYVSVGKLLRQRELLAKGAATADGIMAWMRAQPDGGRSLMRENPSYIFFRELTGPGPLGALNIAVTPQMTVAADPNFVPLGAPVFLTADALGAGRLWVAQDTGGAIKGANRFDTFWGAGAAAKAFSGALSSNGSALLLLPRGVVQRAGAAHATTKP